MTDEQKTASYIVTKRGVSLKLSADDNEKIGAKVKLTESKAAGLVGKVVLASSYAQENKKDDALRKDLSKSVATNEQLTDDNALLTEQLTKLTEQLQKPKK